MKYFSKWKKNKSFENEINKFFNAGCIILDEIHERTLLSDLCIGSVREINAYYKDLKVFLMSATIDHLKFLGYFNFN